MGKINGRGNAAGNEAQSTVRLRTRRPQDLSIAEWKAIVQHNPSFRSPTERAQDSLGITTSAHEESLQSALLIRHGLNAEAQKARESESIGVLPVATHSYWTASQWNLSLRDQKDFLHDRTKSLGQATYLGLGKGAT